MSKVAFFNVGAAGHVYPALPVVSELIRRGESVVFSTSPQYRDIVERSGAEFRSYDTSPVNHVRPYPTILHLAESLLKRSREMLPAILRELERTDYDYIIHDCLAPWGRFAAQITGLPRLCSSATLAMHPAIAEGAISRGRRLQAALRGVPAAGGLIHAASRLRKEYQVTGFGLLDLVTNHAPLNLVYTTREFQPRAELFDESYCFLGPTAHELAKPDDFPLKELDGRRVVYVSLGTLHNVDPLFFKLCMAAFDGRQELVVIALGPGTDISSLQPFPQNCIVRNFVPQFEVLRRADLFITRGGLHSMSDSFWHAVPVLVFPRSFEHLIQARRVEELGAGRIMTERGITPESLYAAGSEVMADGHFRESAAKIGDSFRAAGGSAGAADAVLSHVGRQAVLTAS